VNVNVTVAAGGGSASIYMVDENNLDTAADGALIGSITFTGVNQVGSASVDGWLTATLDNGVDPAGPMYCMAATDLVSTGRNMITCVGQSPGDSTRFYNTVMVSLD
jgi:hypothetical protein